LKAKVLVQRMTKVSKIIDKVNLMRALDKNRARRFNDPKNKY
jgi:hypothetical protein